MRPPQKPCHDCGHAHPTMAHAYRGGPEPMERSFCHESDHSCYVDRYGDYFTDTPPQEIADALENILGGLLKHIGGRP